MEYNNNFNGNQNEYMAGAKISIIGVGGGGGNAVNHMIDRKIESVRYIAINTDHQDLDKKSNADIKISLSQLGAGGNPTIAKDLAEKSRDDIKSQLKGQDMIFITAGMGGGTGTGAAPVVASIAKELGALTVAVVTQPFDFEGVRRKKNAQEGIDELRKYVDALIVLPNQKLLKYKSENQAVSNMFSKPNEVLYRSVKGIAEVITKEGMMNIDFADVSSVMKDAGDAVIGLGEAKEGEDVLIAVKDAAENQLLNRSLKGAKNALINLTLHPETDVTQFEKIMDEVAKYSGNPDLNIILGIIYDDTSRDVKVTIVATGFDDDVAEEGQPVPKFSNENKVEEVNNNYSTLQVPVLD